MSKLKMNHGARSTDHTISSAWGPSLQLRHSCNGHTSSVARPRLDQRAVGLQKGFGLAIQGPNLHMFRVGASERGDAMRRPPRVPRHASRFI